MILNSEPLVYSDLVTVINEEREGYTLSRKKNGARYCEIACAFDIETSSWYESGEKRACMYIWQFGINGHVFIGRTWNQFLDFLNELVDILQLSDEKRLVIYVHNLAYEFQFMHKWLNISEVFAIKERTPVTVLCSCGIEFKCSYILSGYSLAKLADQLQFYQVKKLVGDLDYSKIRHSETPLTEKELSYCVNDVLVVMAYIQELMQKEGTITRIPQTKTGYVRRYTRNRCFYPDQKADKRKKSFNRWKYTSMIKNLVLDPEEYQELKRAFSGGFTHASGFYSGTIVHDVTSYDFTSSYPYVMVSEQFPMNAGEKVTIKSKKEFYSNLNNYCCMFDIELFDIQDEFIYDHYISESKCFELENATCDNGRIIKADRIKLTVTEQDYSIIRKTYKWKKALISNFYRYEKSYLPTEFVKSILALYGDKTMLKGIQGKEAEYLSAKENVNGLYGMTVTDIVRPEILYSSGHWIEPIEPDLAESINEYNTNPGRFLFYPWGVWVTAYARRNLWTGILEFGEDYVYSDTDSIKAINIDSHMHYIENYNTSALIKLHNACKYHGIPEDLIKPKTIEGVEKPLGVWDFDGHYNRFKTLGAKRYMIETDEGINITVSGLNKKVTVPYLCKNWCFDISDHAEHDSPFEIFTNGMYVPAEFTGKNTHTYIDLETSGTVIDYTGKKGTYNEKSSVHMEAAEYSLSIAQNYIDYLLGIHEL